MNITDIVIIGVAVLAVVGMIAGVYWDSKKGFGKKQDPEV
jgi:hypothetical protein